MKFVKLLLALCAAFLLAACNHPYWVKDGETYQQVINQLGAPDSEMKLPDGSTRLVYSQEPMGPEVWALIFSPDGTLIKKEQILYTKYFAEHIKAGMTEADIYQLFGRPCEMRNYPLSQTHDWMYRYVQVGLPWAL